MEGVREWGGGNSIKLKKSYYISYCHHIEIEGWLRKLHFKS